MPRHSKSITKRHGTRKHRMRGGSKVIDWLKKAYNFVKDKKLISSGLSMIPHPYAQLGSTVAGLVGLGRKRIHRRLYRC